jgi:rhamnulokinase
LKKEIYSLAFDFGASSGRAILSKFDGENIELEEIYRFSNEPVRIGGHFYWDFLRLFHELKNGLKKASAKGVKISSIGIDTWGVDYGLLDKDDNLLGVPFHYRDTRTDHILEEIEKVIPFERIYNSTGIQYIQFNTLYQLYADLTQRPHILKEAKTLLFMPDLFSFFLTGSKYTEYSAASTAQMLNAAEKNWDYELLKQLSLPTDILQKVIMPGEITGRLTKEIQEEVGLGEVPVVAVGGHDTASAVAGAPLEGDNRVFLSSGTWSLLGMECKEPIINEASYRYNFTNEGGVCGTIRFLKNINGTWLLQQLRQSWSEHVEKISFPDIIEAAMNAKYKNYIIHPNDKKFMAPLNMAAAIEEYCVENGEGKPEGLGELAMAVYNGLVFEYMRAIKSLEEITGKEVETINIFGGGIQDEFLCQLTADATGKRVLAGPIEASAFGNVIVQLMAVGEIKSLEEARNIIRNSSEQREYMPKNKNK